MMLREVGLSRQKETHMCLPESGLYPMMIRRAV
jgi:hypothetical protein